MQIIQKYGNFVKIMSQSKYNLQLGKIILKNFKTYYGSVTVELSLDTEKTITIIHGEMGKGKTTLINAIYWCLYGKIRTDNERKGVTDESIISNDVLSSLNTGNSNETSVEIHLYEDDVIQYKIKRCVEFKKTQESEQTVFNSDISGRISRGIDVGMTMEYMHLPKKPGKNEWEIVIDPGRVKDLIQNIFPESLSSYFLFDAELLENLFDISSKDNVKNGIEKISGLPVIDNAIKHLRLTQERMKKVELKDVKLEPLKEHIFFLEGKINDIENDMKKAAANLEEYKKESEENNAYLRNHDEVVIKEIQGRRDEIKKNLHKIKEEATKKDKEFNDWLLRTSIIIQLKNSLRKSLKKCDKWEDDGKIPIAVSNQALKNILKSMKCICGTHLVEDSLARNHMEKLLKQNGPDSSIIQDITTGRGHWESILDGLDNPAESLQKFRADRDKINNEYEAQNSLKNNQNEKLAQHDEQKIQEYGIRGKELYQLEIDAKSKLSLADEKHKQSTNELQQNKLELNMETDKDYKYKSYTTRRKLADAIEQILDKCREQLVGELRIKVADKTTHHFSLLVPRLDIKRVEIMDDYKTIVKGSDEKDKGLSAGQRCCLALSYIAAIREITDKNYFMVIDSPLLKMSAEERVEIAKNLPKFIPGTQITLLVQDQEYTGKANQEIKGKTIPSVRETLLESDKLWKEYLLKHTVINNSYHTTIEEVSE